MSISTQSCLACIFALAVCLSIPNPAQSATKTWVSASANATYLKHENYDANGYTTNTESGWLPGAQIAVFRSSKYLISRFSFDAYSGNIGFKKIESNNISTSQTAEKLARISYRLDFNRPRQFYHFYSKLSFNDWQRDVQRDNARRYQWWRGEAGIQLKAYHSRYNMAYFDFAVSRNLFNKMLLDLSASNMGKPLLKPKSKFGGSANAVYAHRFNRKQTGELYVQINYWQFGKSNSRIIRNNVETLEVRENESQSITSSIGMRYSYRF